MALEEATDIDLRFAPGRVGAASRRKTAMEIDRDELERLRLGALTALDGLWFMEVEKRYGFKARVTNSTASLVISSMLCFMGSSIQ